MEAYFKDIKFKYKWRPYQKRVLLDLEEHLDDNHLHIIAPPGSGKTVLGLEVAIRLNKPTLIFAPTIAIRNQWVQRFCELFLQVNKQPNWISRDIKKPEFLTIVTYQALHATCTNTTIDEEIEDDEDELEKRSNRKATRIIDTKEIVKALKAKNIGTIVVDEAHHLKNEWWKSLNAVKTSIKPTIVGLTATPPYDVSYKEWERYIDLNGPVDAEISVPELVVENDLCPHQDYVLISEPTEGEHNFISQHRKKALIVFNDIIKDESFINALMSHPIYEAPLENLDSIYSNLEYYSAVLIFLKAAGKIVSQQHVEIIGNKKFEIPPLNYEWIEILLSFYLFDKNNYSDYYEHKESLINKLKRNGLIEKKTIRFRHNKKINSSLSNSLNKLKSIDKIVDLEHDCLNDKLRMVILTDYIRKDFLINEPVNNLALNKIGVLPIFEQLRRTNDRNLKLGVLTGSLIIIPQKSLPAFVEAAKAVNINSFTHSSVPYDQQYIIINASEKLKHDIVQIVTQVFEQGEIEILIGTKSLLGEGWDAPTINSLILASFVGSYVLSNQMRGRAIRSDRNNPNKTSNIWHLVCVDRSDMHGGDDIQLLKRRFKSFVGVSNGNDTTIENGIERLNLPEELNSSHLNDFNKKMKLNAGERELLKQKWQAALVNGESLTEEIKVPFPEDKNYKQTKKLYYDKTIANMFAVLGSSLIAFLDWILEIFGRTAKNIHSQQDLYKVLMVIGAIGVLFFSRQTYLTFRLFIKYHDISKDIHQIGETLLQSLIKMNIINTEHSKLEVVSSVNDFGAIYCHLEGGTTYEKSTFIKALQEIISTVDNPRYLIIRKKLFLKLISQKDYHSVPEFIGRNKKTAEYFEKQWRKLVGACELVYTRTIEGRKILLQSRINSLSSEFEEKTERISKWR
ncbi:DEAD/DEAH box helicase family protein [Saccharicrinis aurantiacus]|uniref:DEAD/DEAH box helicase family protein n=1 Tax=Saccharicrinis aurantiacus TaxID=1849719 RepID=UPI002493CDDA|nr:DEAD/DEAH box helicase family protein [Saccharicrinis aurantiacus]